MPSIQPFQALLPAHDLESEIVTRPLDYYSIGEARLIASESQYSFLHLIDPSLHEPSWRDLRPELIYRKIRLSTEQFIEDGALIKFDKPALYIYECTTNGIVQNGIWCLCHAEDYLSGAILKHELTVERREKMLSDYLEATGLDSNPVLLTYPPSATINAYIVKYKETVPLIDFIFRDGSTHRIWAVKQEDDIKAINECIMKVGPIYIADGHHRAAAMKNHAEFSAVLINAEEVKIKPYNRLIKGLNGNSPSEFLDALTCSFKVTRCAECCKPSAHHEIGMYVAGHWYELNPIEGIFNQDHPVERLDVNLLQEKILAPILGITSPGTDARITFAGADLSAEGLQMKVDSELYSVAFTLFPVQVQDLMSVADAGLIMPPKSTWIEPKFLVGLLTNYKP